MKEATSKSNVFRNPNYLLLFLGALVSNLGSSFYNFAVSFYILKITQDNAFIQGCYLAVSGTAFVAAGFFGGVIADRWNKVRIIYGTDYIRGAMILIGALLLYLFRHDVTAQLIILFIIAVLFNVFAAIFSPASTAIIQTIIDEDKFQQASSYLSSMNNMLTIIGTVLGALFYSILPISWLFVMVSVLYIGSAISEMFIRCRHTPDTNRLTLLTMLRDIQEGFRYIVNQKILLTIMVASLFANFFFTPISTSLSYFVDMFVKPQDYLFRAYLAPEYWVSIMSISLGIGSILTALILGNRRQTEIFHRPILTGFCGLTGLLILLTVCFFLLANTAINVLLILMTVAVFGIGVCLILVNIPVNTYTLKTVDPDKIAKVSALSAVGSMGLTPIASFLGGVLISKFGYGSIPVMSSVGFLTITVVLLSNRHVRSI